tara:strand:- start:27672 stop:27863 length:192 start_codon:yes stop_codon:yes gene_type:complete
MPQKISMMVSTGPRFQPVNDFQVTPPHKVLASVPKGQSIGMKGLSIIERIRHTPAGCGSCGGR